MELPLSSANMRIILLACLLGMEILAATFLSRRRMTFWAYVCWGMLAATIPVLGPFLVILIHPGRQLLPHTSARLRRRARKRSFNRQLQAFITRLAARQQNFWRNWMNDEKHS